MNDTFTQCVEFVAGILGIMVLIVLGTILLGVAFAMTVAPFVIAYKFLVWIF
jgi:hypothetical protein